MKYFVIGAIVFLLITIFIGGSEDVKKQVELKQKCEQYAFNSTVETVPVGCYEYFRVK